MEGLRSTINSYQNENEKQEKIELRKIDLNLLSSNNSPKVGQAEEDSFLEKAKLKSKAKVVSAWNNVKYGTIGFNQLLETFFLNSMLLIRFYHNIDNISFSQCFQRGCDENAI